MFKKLFRKKKPVDPICGTCSIDHVVYPDGVNNQEEWDRINASTPVRDRPVILGELFSIHEPYPYTGKEFIAGHYKNDIIRLAQQQFQETINNFLPWQIK